MLENIPQPSDYITRSLRSTPPLSSIAPATTEDGLLTAEDVTGVDLRGMQLVVLSACDTGLGELQVGEGIHGLPRAFVLAGARALVVRLWKVPDQQTKESMVAFFRRLHSCEACADAFRKAQLAMKAKQPDPPYWGAFIFQGDPSPLRPDSSLKLNP